MNANINGYTVISDFTTADAGMCRWAIATKDGHEYFIKEFLSPKYPVDASRLGPELTQKMKEAADAFFQKKRELYSHLAQCRTGNNVIVLDFFRYGAKFYAVSDRITGDMLSVRQIADLGSDQKFTLIKSILYSASKLHEAGIIHSDLKPENILVKKSFGTYCTAKIIDFDAGFLETAVPDKIEGSQNYFSPEAVQRTNGEAVSISTKSDVWALGLLIHQYWCGRIPAFSRNYNYAAEAVLNGSPLEFSDSLPKFLKDLLSSMLDKDPEKRPSAQEAWQIVFQATCDRSEKSREHTVTSPLVKTE